MVDIKLLQNVELFEFLTEDDLSKLLPVFEEHHFVADEVIFNEGDAGDTLCIITDGEVNVSRKIGEDEDLVLAKFGKHAFFGEMSLLDEKPRSATVRALIDGSYYVMKRGVFMHLINTDPEMASKMLLALAKVFCNRHRKTSEQLRTYSLINKAMVENEQFRKLYIASHT